MVLTIIKINNKIIKATIMIIVILVTMQKQNHPNDINDYNIFKKFALPSSFK